MTTNEFVLKILNELYKPGSNDQQKIIAIKNLFNAFSEEK